MKRGIEQIPERDLLGEAPEVIANRLVEKWRVNIPTIRRDDAEIEDKEAKADARAYPGRFHVPHVGRSEIPATEFKVSVPFDGDAAEPKKERDESPATLTTGFIAQTRMMLSRDRNYLLIYFPGGRFTRHVNYVRASLGLAYESVAKSAMV